MKTKIAAVAPAEYRIWCEQCCIRIAPNEEKALRGGKNYHPRCLLKIVPARAKAKARSSV